MHFRTSPQAGDSRTKAADIPTIEAPKIDTGQAGSPAAKKASAVFST